MGQGIFKCPFGHSQGVSPSLVSEAGLGLQQTQLENGLFPAQCTRRRPCSGDRDPGTYQFQFSILEPDMGIQRYFGFGA